MSHYTHDLGPGFPGTHTAASTIFIALRIVEKYPRRHPTRDELMRDFGMSRATAYRWLVGIRSARGAMPQEVRRVA